MSMGIGASLFLIAVGAVLVFAVEATGPGWLNLDMIGWILMGVGLLGILLSLAFWRRRAVVDEGPPVVTERHMREI
jgi:hypothetical protein